MLIKRASKLLKPCFKDKVVILILFGMIITGIGTTSLMVTINQLKKYIFNGLEQKDLKLTIQAIGSAVCFLAIIAIAISEKATLMNLFSLRIRKLLYNHYGKKALSDNLCTVPCQRLSQDLSQFGSQVIYLFNLVFLTSIRIITFGIIVFSLAHYLVVLILFTYALFMAFFAKKIAKPISEAEYQMENKEGILRRELINQIKSEFKVLPSIEEVLFWKKKIIFAERKLIYLISTHDQLKDYMLYILLLPAYFASKMTLGELMQTNHACVKFLDQINFFLNNRESLVMLDATMKRIEELNKHYL